MQRVLERCTDEQKGAIMQEILQAFSSLAEDKYGNYVVQVYRWMYIEFKFVFESKFDVISN